MSVGRESRKALVGTFKSRWTFGAVVLGLAIAIGVRQAAMEELADPVFGCTATFVALILPSAALANEFLEGRLTGYLDLVRYADDPSPQDFNRVLHERAQQVAQALDPLLRGFAFLLLAFPLAIGALFHVRDRVWTSGPDWLHLRVIDILLGGAIAFDLLAIVLFVPFAWLLLNGKLLESTQEMLKAFADNPPKRPPSAP
jgi:hypothetical protein